MDIRGINLDSLEGQITSMVRDIQGEFQAQNLAQNSTVNLKDSISLSHASFEARNTNISVEKGNA